MFARLAMAVALSAAPPLLRPAPLPAQTPLARLLDRRLDAAPLKRFLWGLAVADDRGRLLYGRNADRLFVPASTAKVFVSAVAAARLPADGTVRTSVYATGPVAAGVVEGDLVLYGRGDPTMDRRCYGVDTTRALALNVGERIARLEEQFSADLVLRSAVWLTVKESRASFAIEHEDDQRDRVQRFAAVIEQRTGQSADPLNPAELEALQREILGPNALRYGLRRSPMFVGETARFGEERVHYIGPHWDDVPSILTGLRELLTRTAGLSSVARAALVSFGFVYLHPMIDGNGRISRFLINDVLRRDGALPAPYIVPISAILQRPDLRPLSYDGALELFSRPLMQQYRNQWSFGAEQQGQDGVTYNLQFDGYQDALHAWRYPDLTHHVGFLADVLDLTIEQEMRSEAQYLQRHRAARTRLKTIVEGPDPELDRIIRSVRESRGTISGKLRAEYPMLERAEIADDVVRAIREEFPWTAANEG